MTTLFKLALVLVATMYQIVLMLVFCYQDLLVFPGSVLPMYSPQVKGVEVQTYTLADKRQCRLAVAHPKKPPKAVVLYFVGNGEGLNRCQYWADFMARGEGYLTLCPEYPGYGKGSGRAAKDTCLEAANLTAKRAQAHARRLGVPLYVIGHSLGTFMATHIVAQGIGSKLLLVSPPTSILDRARAMFPIFPMRCLVRHDFDNLELAPKIRCKTLVLHGDRDRIVPIGEGRRVARRIAGAELLEVAGGSHNPITLYMAKADAVRKFLR